MRKITMLCCIVLFAWSLWGCGNQVKEEIKISDKNIKIGISVYDQYDTFIAGLMDAVQDNAKKKGLETGNTISLDVVNAAGSQTEQNNQIENFIKSNCDVICVNLVDRTDASMIIDKAKAADIPVIFFNRELVPEDLERWDKLYYVGAVALESGIMQGQIVKEYYENNQENMDTNKDGVIQYVMLEGEAGHQDSIVRTEYSVNTITESGIMVEKLSYAIANWNRAQAQTKMTLWLEQFGGRIELVLANNDDMALGALDAIKASKSNNSMPVIVGIDGTDVGLEAVANGEMLGTVYNDKEGQARGIIDLAFSLTTGTELPQDIRLTDGKYIRLPHKIITKNT